MLVELIERKERWDQTVGPRSSDPDEEDHRNGGGDEDLPDWEWDDTVRGDPRTEAAAREEAAREEKERAEKVKLAADDRRQKQMREESKSSSSSSKKKKSEKKSKSHSKKHKTAEPSGKPSALTSVIYPALSKLLKQTKDEETVKALTQLKDAFDNAVRQISFDSIFLTLNRNRLNLALRTV